MRHGPREIRPGLRVHSTPGNHPYIFDSRPRGGPQRLKPDMTRTWSARLEAVPFPESLRRVASVASVLKPFTLPTYSTAFPSEPSAIYHCLRPCIETPRPIIRHSWRNNHGSRTAAPALCVRRPRTHHR